MAYPAKPGHDSTGYFADLPLTHSKSNSSDVLGCSAFGRNIWNNLSFIVRRKELRYINGTYQNKERMKIPVVPLRSISREWQSAPTSTCQLLSLIGQPPYTVSALQQGAPDPRFGSEPPGHIFDDIKLIAYHMHRSTSPHSRQRKQLKLVVVSLVPGISRQSMYGF